MLLKPVDLAEDRAQLQNVHGDLTLLLQVFDLLVRVGEQATPAACVNPRMRLTLMNS